MGNTLCMPRPLTFASLYQSASVSTSCTSILITKDASADGSVMISHSDDNDLLDHSIVFVPAKNWPSGAQRPVYASAAALGPLPEYNAYHIPRLADADRAPGYSHPSEPQSIPLGHIPQVVHTFAYLDGNYGIMNEHGLAFGQCTNCSYFNCGPEPGKRVFHSPELTRVALERCRTARDAIRLIGRLVETYGYYGGGETIPIADAEEAWVMEIAPSPEGAGGLWVAQRIPDGHFFVAANTFRIREIDPCNPDQTRGDAVFEVLARSGFLRPGKHPDTFDWAASVSPGEYNHPYHSLRRIWRAQSLAAPSQELSPWLRNPDEGGLAADYPFSIRPDRPISLQDLKNMHRDQYQGTEFDLTRGMAAGPFGNPNRYQGRNVSCVPVDDTHRLQGAWERPIGMCGTGYTYINQIKPGLPHPINAVSWIALASPAESVFLPLAVGPLPSGYEKGDARIYDPQSAWRVCNLVAEYANTKYCYAIQDIRKCATLHEEYSEQILDALWQTLQFKAIASAKEAAAVFRQELANNAEDVLDDWRLLFERLVVKYNQGSINTPGGFGHRVGYPREWLESTNFYRGPVSYSRPNNESS